MRLVVLLELRLNRPQQPSSGVSEYLKTANGSRIFALSLLGAGHRHRLVVGAASRFSMLLLGVDASCLAAVLASCCSCRSILVPYTQHQPISLLTMVRTRNSWVDAIPLDKLLEVLGLGADKSSPRCFWPIDRLRRQTLFAQQAPWPRLRLRLRRLPFSLFFFFWILLCFRS